MEVARHGASPTWRCRTWPAIWARATIRARGCSLSSSRVERDRVADQRLARRSNRPQTFFHDVSLHLHREFKLLCGIAPSLGMLLFFRRAAGRGWRRPAAHGAGHPRGYFSAAATRPCLRALRHHGAHRADDRPDPRRLDHVQLFLALWIFFINLPVGLLTLFLVLRFVEDPPYLALNQRPLAWKLDYIGISLLALGVGALQILLDKGQEADDWFGSPFITTLAVIAVVCLVGLIVWEWFQKSAGGGRAPVQEFQLREFQPDDVQVLGIMLFSSLVLMPLFSADADGIHGAGGRPSQISAGGLCLLIEMPIMGQLTTKIQARRLIAFGLAVPRACHVLFHQAHRFADRVQHRAVVAGCAGFRNGFSFCAHHTGGLHRNSWPEKNNAVSGIVNFDAQYGEQRGNFCFVTTLLARRAQYHQQILVSHTGGGSPRLQGAVIGLTQQLTNSGMDRHAAQLSAYARIYLGLLAQSSRRGWYY